ncbi:MAG TPA: hypothetical protein VG106_13070 [Vicinamibacterales bacterium]|nr:hypothetical protein [Vicinamibacterales bacterium]
MTPGDLTRDLGRALRNEASVPAAVATWLLGWQRLSGFSRALLLMKLGRDTRSVISGLDRVLGRDAPALAALLAVADRVGCSVVDAVDALAASIDERARDRAAAHAAATAARKSARAMVLMPLVGTPFLMLGGAPVFDGAGLGFLGISVALMYAGWRWIDRLVPDPPHDVPELLFCDLIACALAGGATPGDACSDVAALFPAVAKTPARRVRLGFTWPEALAMSNVAILRRAGLLLLRQERSGTPVAQELCLLTRSVRDGRRSAFDISLKAAPVRMIWPLVVCSLPAFSALTVVPLVRGIAGSL